MIKKFTIGTNIGDVVFVLLVILFFGFILLHDQLIFYPVWVFFMAIAGYFWLSSIRLIDLYEEGFEVRHVFQKGAPLEKIPYSEIEEVRFVYASIKGEHSLAFSYVNQEDNIVVRSSYRNHIPERELRFLKSKGVVVKIHPEGKLDLSKK